MAVVRIAIVEGDLSTRALAAINELLRDCGEPRIEIAPLVVQQQRVMVADLIARVAYETGISRARIIGLSRVAGPVRARRAICWLAIERFAMSSVRVGRDLGKRDHSTILYLSRTASALRERDPAFRQLTDRIAADLAGGRA